MTISLTTQSVIGGMDLPAAVERLGIRPLAFGSAWKVLDLLLEYALAEAGLSPANRKQKRWRIDEKIAHARSGNGQAAPLSTNKAVWQRLMTAYAETEEVRHSLVHRRATVGAAGEVTGADRSGNALRALTLDEQVHFMRAAQRAVKYLQQNSLSSRDEAAILGELDKLAGVTSMPSTGHSVVSHPPIPYRIPVEEGQELDLALIKSRIRRTTPTVSEFDVRLPLVPLSTRCH
jgi:hypothetical protein